MGLKQIAFEIVDSLHQISLAGQRNGRISKKDRRVFALKSMEFKLRHFIETNLNLHFDSLKVGGQNLSFLDHKFFKHNFQEVFVNEEYFFECSNKSPVIVDCGSNIGLATLYFKRIYPNAQILAIEAHPETYSVLKKNIVENGLTDVHTKNVAVIGSDENETILFSLDKGDLRTTRIKELYGEGADKLSQIVVKAAKLSSLLPDKIDLLKMDIEGSEVEVLEEIKNELHRIDQILVEFHYIAGKSLMTIGQFIGFLEDAGFVCRMSCDSLPRTLATNDQSFTATIHGQR